VHAAVARLDVAHEPLGAPEREVRVALERRQQVACRQLTPTVIKRSKAPAQPARSETAGLGLLDLLDLLGQPREQCSRES